LLKVAIRQHCSSRPPAAAWVANHHCTEFAQRGPWILKNGAKANSHQGVLNLRKSAH